jgi:hypothetical protein
MKSRLTLFIWFFIFSILFAQANYPGDYNSLIKYSGQSLFDIVNVPEDNINIGLWALIIAKEYDNTIGLFPIPFLEILL